MRTTIPNIRLDSPPSAQLLSVGCFCALSITIFDSYPLNFRPVPYQLVGDYVIRDPSLDQAYGSITIDDISLGIIGIAGPLAFFLVASNALFPRRSADYKCHNALCSYFVGVGLSEGCTAFLKRYVGRLRPNFYAMCGWDDASLSCTETRAAVIEQARKR